VRRLTRILVVGVLLLTTITVVAQQRIFKTYSVSDGLVNNSVRRIFQDSKGFLWIATWEGLSKYDGNRFTNFTESNGLSHNLVNDVVELPSGDMYVAMNNGAVDVVKDDRVKKAGQFSNIIVNRFQFDRTGRLVASTDGGGIAEVRGGLRAGARQGAQHAPLSGRRSALDLLESLAIWLA